jgi:hypothetical protein
MLYDRSRTEQEYVPVGVVRDFGLLAKAEKWLEVEVKTPLRQGDMVEYLGRDINAVSFAVAELLDQDGIPLVQANPGAVVRIKHNLDPGTVWEVNGLLRKKKQAPDIKSRQG